MIVYIDVPDEWYIEWQQVVQRMKKSDNEWYNEWQQMAMSDSEWHSGTTNKTGTVYFKEWMITILSMTKTNYYYFKGWMAAIRVVK